jgi:hypothetical protein
MNMKKIIYIIAAVLCLLTSCKKELTLEEKIIGDWHCTAKSVKAEIYVTFTTEKTFALYQQIGEGSYRVYNGTWSIDGTTLRGQYNDGSSWATSYEVASTDDNTLSLTAEGITETYSRVSGGIPEEVLASCVTVVKSKGVETVAFL